MNNRIFLLLGANLGDRMGSLKSAIAEIEESTGVLKRKSSVYQTAALGKLDQPDFLNQVIEIETTLSPGELLETILGIESKLGRERKEKWGERLIDIDILLFSEEIIQSKKLTIPHPQLANRRFTLIPLVEIASDVIHPISKKSMAQLLTECVDSLPVVKL